jgi:hypothetical protein
MPAVAGKISVTKCDRFEKRNRRGGSLYPPKKVRNGGTTVKRLMLVTFLLGFSLLVNIPMATAQFSEAGVEKFRVAVEAPDFTLKQLGGGKISLKELRGKVVLLNFFAPY